MKRYGWSILLVVAACTPQYESGKTRCSDDKECPGGFSCSDDGTNGTHYCVDNKSLGCPDTSTFYCSQSKTCWTEPAACATAVKCDATSKNPGWVICVTLGYHPDCNGDTCLPNGSVPDAGTGKGGAGGARSGGALGGGGAGGSASSGKGGVSGTGGRSLSGGGTYGSGGATTARGGSSGAGGLYRTGGTTGLGGSYGSGGSTSGTSLCSGTPTSCSVRLSQAECQMGTGCAWNGTTATCSGSVYPCNRYTSATTCLFNDCTWSGPLVCKPTPVTSFCASQEASTACEACWYGSCCGPFEDCLNDTTCATSTSGPLWDAYLDCLANCCFSACTS